MRLLAGKPGWTVKADVIVIGSGVAGLTSALNLRAHNLSVLLVTDRKSTRLNSSHSQQSRMPSSA